MLEHVYRWKIPKDIMTQNIKEVNMIKQKDKYVISGKEYKLETFFNLGTMKKIKETETEEEAIKCISSF